MSINNKQWLGLPLNLLWGYIAIAVFMTGDGFELAFLSHYIKALGFSPAEASFAFTLYGLAAALSAWISGVVAEIITPLKTMMIGFVLWCVFHVLFLVFGLGHANYALILVFYGIRGFAYPLFLYSFIVAIVHNVKSDNASSAIGWFWAVYSIGIGVFGSYIPSFTIPHIGEMGTLWLALAFCVTGGVIALASLRHIKTPQHMQNLTTREKFAELGRAATLLYTNRNILLSSMVRIINTLSLFGFAVIMPMMFVDELGFSTSEWLQVWAVFFFTTIFSNVLWGILGEKLGWMKVVRWFGCIGMALSSLAFYYIPQHFGHSFAMALIPAIALGSLSPPSCRWPPCSRRWSRSTKARRFRCITCRRGCRTFWRRRSPWCCCRSSAPLGSSSPIPHCTWWPFSSVRLSASSSRDFPTRKRRPASRWSSLKVMRLACQACQP